MARKLHDRLALASYKTQHGQENLNFNDVEARLEKTIRWKRTAASSIGTSSTTSSTTSSSSSNHPFFSGGLASSPLTAPFSSGSGDPRSSRKRNINQFTTIDYGPKPNKRVRSQSMAPPLFESSRASWKSTHNLPESSPVYRHQSHFSSSRGLDLSFKSDTTIPASPPFGHVSDDEDHDLPSHSFSMGSTFRSSPPRTPPPSRSRAARQSKGNAAGEEGADLLLYLATSPSPANRAAKSSRIFVPSTPPSKNLAFPSSMTTTPGMAGFNTPGQQFNFADFVNITPSPAQGAFGNTPGLTKTPLAAKEARRRLNLETLVPPGLGSPNISNVGRGSRNADSGLGMELGGELVS